VRVVYVLEKLLDVSEPGLEEVGYYIMVSDLTLAVSWVHEWGQSVQKKTDVGLLG
jgi:hypothetical protein